MTKNNHEQDFATRSVQSDHIDQNEIHSKVTPIYQTSAFAFENLTDLEAYFSGEREYLYTRYGNPNTDEFAQAVAHLENAPAGAAAASGLASIFTAIISVAKAGDHILAAQDLYGGTIDLLENVLPDFGIETTFVDFSNQKAVRASLAENTKILYSETITNPLLRVEDLEFLVDLGREKNLVTMVDNTFATPYLIRPYELGIDYVIHSVTKYLGGHSDVTAGVVLANADRIQRVGEKIQKLGPSLSPFQAWLALRGVKTMDVRMERHNKNAEALAEAMESNDLVKTVYYPKSVSSQGNGAIVTLELDHSLNIEKFFEALTWVRIIPSLAGVETTVSYPDATSHRNLTDDQKHEIGINKYLVRVSLGLESAKDIIDEFNQAIDKAK